MNLPKDKNQALTYKALLLQGYKLFTESEWNCWADCSPFKAENGEHVEPLMKEVEDENDKILYTAIFDNSGLSFNELSNDSLDFNYTNYV